MTQPIRPLINLFDLPRRKNQSTLNVLTLRLARYPVAEH